MAKKHGKTKMDQMNNLRLMIVQLEDEIKEEEKNSDPENCYDLDSAYCHLADLRDELKELEG